MTHVPRWLAGALFVVGLATLVTAGNVIWMKREILTIPPAWDQAFYLYRSVRYWRALTEGGPRGVAREYVRGDPQTAPLFPLTTVPLYAAFGESREVAHLTNALYLALLLGLTVALGAHTASLRAGLVAAFALATFPGVVNYSRDYLFEFPASAFVTLAVYGLARSDGWRSTRWSIVFGLGAALTVLTKTMTGIFLVGPTAWIAVRTLRERTPPRIVLGNLGAAALVGALVAATWWLPNLVRAWWYLTYYGFGAGSVPYQKGLGTPFSLDNMTYYGRYLVLYGISVPWAVVFALVATVALRQRLRTSGLLWVWLAGGYIALTLVPNKGEERYALSLLPPLALLIAAMIDRLHPAWCRAVFAAAVVAVGTFNYAELTFARGERLWPAAVRAGHVYPQYEWLRRLVPRSAPGIVPVGEVLDRIAADHPGGDAAVLVAPDHPVLNASTLRYGAERRRLRLKLDHLWADHLSPAGLRPFDYVVVKRGGYQGPEFSTRATAAITDAVARPDSGFIQLGGALPFPDGAEVAVFARRHE